MTFLCGVCVGWILALILNSEPPDGDCCTFYADWDEDYAEPEDGSPSTCPSG